MAALGTSSCLSPGTLPLPPPSLPDVEGPDEQGFATLSGRVTGGALVFALNPRSLLIGGQLTDGSGLYRFPIPAEEGDELVLWYEVGGRTSPTRSVSVPEAQ
ncbi:MAG TPA: hypothetical protein VF989_00125 [Polyangiaceae bacterium]|jgi:hypothetical protein